MMRAAGFAVALGLACVAGRAWPQEVVTFGQPYHGAPMPVQDGFVPSSVSIGPTQWPNALASVTFRNENVNGPRDTGQRRELVGQGLRVKVEFTYTEGADRVVLTPPPGVECHPSCVITLEEGSAGTVTLYDARAVNS